MGFVPPHLQGVHAILRQSFIDGLSAAGARRAIQTGLRDPTRSVIDAAAVAGIALFSASPPMTLLPMAFVPAR
jgi:hypothetical protein